MFGIGFSEILIIALVAILLIRPEDLPKFFRALGTAYRRIKKEYDEFVELRKALLKEFDLTETAEQARIVPRPSKDAKEKEPQEKEAHPAEETETAVPENDGKESGAGPSS